MFYYFGAQEKVGAGADRSCFASAYAFSSSVDVCVIHFIANVCVTNWSAVLGHLVLAYIVKYNIQVY